MKNLFVMEDVGSDEADSTDGDAVSAAHPPQIQPQVEDSGADNAAGSVGVISSEPAQHEHQSESSGESQTDNTS